MRHATRTRRGLALPLLTALAGCAALSPAGAAAPPIAGTWRWSDGDEALANPRNPTLLVVRAHARASRMEARFGRGPWVPLTWRPGSRSFAFTAVRRIGPRGGRSAAVRYRGRLVRAGGAWRARGTLRIRARAYRGASSFTAVRLG